VAPHSAVAVARRSSGNSGSTRASEEGTSIAPPSACTTRAPTSIATEPAAPHTTEAARKSSRPAKKKRRRPKRSESRPAGTSAAAKTIAYAFRIHESPLSELPGNDALMSGNAMLTIVTSRKVMKTPTDVTRSTCQRRAINVSLASKTRPLPQLRGTTDYTDQGFFMQLTADNGVEMCGAPNRAPTSGSAGR
jgi:hypothetical protein